MAITWGNTSGYFRLGIDVQVSGTTATIIVYGQSVGYGHNWTERMQYTGAWSGSREVSFYSGFGETVTREFLRWSTSFTGTRTYGVSISYWNGSSSVSRSVTIANPDPPSDPALSQVKRSSDTQHTLTWYQSTGRPVTGFVVQRRNWTGDSWDAWRELARPSSGSRSYTDTTTRAGASYQWRVAAYNGAGQSAFTTPSLPTPTTPAPVARAEAKRVGGTIVISWPRIQSAPDSRIEVERKQGSGSWTSLTTVASTQTEAEDKSPSTTVSQSYRVRQTVRSPHDGGLTLYSNWMTTNAVSITAPPSEPALIAPTPYYISTGPTVLQWRHYATDGSAQTQAQIAYTLPNGATRTLTVNGSSDRAQVDFSEPGSYKWQVRTKGSHPDYGPWSKHKTHQAINAPTVSILTPEMTVSTRFTTVKWETSQKNGWKQNAWEISLADDSGIELGKWAGTGDTTSFPLPVPVENNKTYKVAVRAAVSGVWSEPTVSFFTVEYTPPAPPDVNVSWDDTAGQATIYVDAGKAPKAESTATITLWRSIDGGVTWESVAEDLEPGSVVSDYEGLSNGTTLYRATAYTSIGGEASAEFELAATSRKLWVGAGPGYAQQVSLEFNPSAGASFTVARSALHFDGRALPVPVLGAGRGGELDVSGLVFDGDAPSLDDIIKLVTGDYITHLVRVPGIRRYGIIRGINTDRTHAQAWQVSLKLEETEKETEGE